MNLCQAQLFRAHSRTVIRAQISYNPAGYAFPIDDYLNIPSVNGSCGFPGRVRQPALATTIYICTSKSRCQVVQASSVDRELPRVRWKRAKPARSRMGGRIADILEQGA